MKRLRDSFGCAALLNLLLPGCGHLYWREYLFGVFVFLVSLLALVLWFASFLLPLTSAVQLVLFGLPAVFYLFTFVDLHRTLKRKRPSARRSVRFTVILLAGGLTLQIVSPVSPTHFAWQNRPSLFRISSQHLAPWLGTGSLAAAVPTDYRVRLPFLEEPHWHSLPAYGDVVRFVDEQGVAREGLVLGFFGDEVQVIDGQLVVDSAPLELHLVGRLRLVGDMTLTLVDRASILIATLNLGAVDQTYQVPVDGVVGRVHRLF